MAFVAKDLRPLLGPVSALMLESMEQTLHNFLRDKHILIVSRHATDRQGMKNVLSNLGATAAQCKAVVTVHGALELFMQKSFNVLVLDYDPSMGTRDLNHLLQKFSLQIPDYYQRLLIVLGNEEDKDTIQRIVTDWNIDCSLSRPFTGSQLKYSLFQAIKTRENSPAALKRYSEMKQRLLAGDLNEQQLNQHLENYQHAWDFYLAAEAQLLWHNTQQAQDYYLNAIDLHPNHPLAAMALFNLYCQQQLWPQAYELAERYINAAQWFRIELQQFLMASLANQRFEHLEELYSYLLQNGELDQNFSQSLCACLSLASKHLCQHNADPTRIRALAELALKLGRGHEKLIVHAVTALEKIA